MDDALDSWHERPLHGCRRGASEPDRSAPAAHPPAVARRARRPAARARRRIGPPACDRGRPAAVDDPLRPARSRQDDARADRRRDHGRRLRGALGRVRARRRRARCPPACPRPARGERGAHDPLPRRDPPLQQGPAGRPAAGRRERPADADRGDHREPVLRGQRGPPLPLRRRRARAALGRRGGSRRRSRRGGARDRGSGGRRRGDRAEGRRRCPQRALDPRALLADGRRRGRAARGTARRRRRPQAPAALRPGRRPALRHHLRVHQVDARQRPRRGRVLPRRDARRR